MARRGAARRGRSGVARCGAERRGGLRQGRKGGARNVPESNGLARQERWGEELRGLEMQGEAGLECEAWSGEEWRSVFWRGKAGMERYCGVGSGTIWRGPESHGEAGKAWRGVVGNDVACSGEARQERCGWVGRRRVRSGRKGFKI